MFRPIGARARSWAEAPRSRLRFERKCALPARGTAGTHSHSIQKISFPEAGGNVRFGDVADVFTDERFDFELEAILEHQF
jgi:hypothetical protein